MNKLKLIMAIVLMLAPGLLVAQQEVQFTQYMYNTLSVNPGYAGSRGLLNVTGLHRSQWVGMEGAPTTQTISMHTPLRYEAVGLGLTIVNDKIGPINNTFIVGDFSYSIKTGEEGKLAFGLKGGLNMLQGTFTTLETIEDADNAFMTNIENNLTPNFGFGMYYHTERYYIGASLPKLLKNEIGLEGGEDNTEQRHLYTIAGIVLDMNDDFKFKPTTLLKLTGGAPASWDISATVLYKEKFWGGLNHRWKDSFGAMLGYHLTEQLRAGYAYDYTISTLNQYNSGSREIMLSYDFIYKRKKVLSPRYF